VNERGGGHLEKIRRAGPSAAQWRARTRKNIRRIGIDRPSIIPPAAPLKKKVIA
jgi:hypothetical protein